MSNTLKANLTDEKKLEVNQKIDCYFLLKVSSHAGAMSESPLPPPTNSLPSPPPPPPPPTKKKQTNKKLDLTFTTLWANSADDTLMIFFFLNFPRKQDLMFHTNCFHWRQFA